MLIKALLIVRSAELFVETHKFSFYHFTFSPFLFFAFCPKTNIHDYTDHFFGIREGAKEFYNYTFLRRKDFISDKIVHCFIFPLRLLSHKFDTLYLFAFPLFCHFALLPFCQKNKSPTETSRTFIEYNLVVFIIYRIFYLHLLSHLSLLHFLCLISFCPLHSKLHSLYSHRI